MLLPLEKQVREFLLSNFYVDTHLNSETSLLETGVIDSTGVLEVIGFIEETFGISVDDSEMLPENLDSIKGIAQYVVVRFIHWLHRLEKSGLSHARNCSLPRW